jgi:hypothetical protein
LGVEVLSRKPRQSTDFFETLRVNRTLLGNNTLTLNGNSMLRRVTSTRTLGIVSLLSFLAFFLLLMLPYYYILGKQAYVPKTNPDLGYFMPKSPEAWLFLIAALSFLVLSLGVLASLVRRVGFE